MVSKILGLLVPADYRRDKPTAGTSSETLQSPINKGRSFLTGPENSFIMWCGEGDLNPHDLSIASTST